MRKVLVIAKREFRAVVTTKAFLVASAIMPLLMFGGMFMQRSLEGRVGPTEKRLVIFDDAGEFYPQLDAAATKYNEHGTRDPQSGKQIHPRYVLERSAEPAAPATRFALSERIRRGEIHAFAEIPAKIAELPGAGEPVRASFYAENAALADERRWLEQTLNDLVRARRLAALGLDPQAVDRASAFVPLQALGLVERTRAGELTPARQTTIEQSIFLPMGMMMLMFLVIMLSAQPMLESVIEEKSQRIAEVLLGSVSAFQLMIGKLLGGVAGSLMVVAIYAAGGYALAWHLDLLELVPLEIIPWFVVYQVLAVLFFGAIFMAIGAAVTQLKEAQSLLLPVWLLMTCPLFVWFHVVREPMGRFATWLSFFPPATPLLMVLRMSASELVPLWQPALGVVILLGITLLTVFVAGRVFRIGFLLQGKAPRVAELVRWAVRG